jgi:DNA polymerase-3 subunit epsilon
MSRREIILDTETTGLEVLDGHRIIEIGALEVIDNILTGTEFHYYLNPGRSVSHRAYEVHGISTEFLQDKPKFDNIARDFLNFIADSNLIIHNAPFDLKFLNHELKLLGLPSIASEQAIDTVLLARRLFPGSRVNLDALCKRYKIDVSHRQYHGAIKDCHLLYKVYIELTGGRQKSFDIFGTGSVANGGFAAENDNETYHAKGNKVIITPSDQELTRYNEFIAKL